jgi:hypothetical protein
LHGVAAVGSRVGLHDRACIDTYELSLFVHLPLFCCLSTIAHRAQSASCTCFSGSKGDGAFFKNVTVCYPVYEGQEYFAVSMKMATRKQLINKLSMKGYELVARVDHVPSTLYTTATCSSAQSIEDVELSDNATIAVVLEGTALPIDKLAKRVKSVESSVSMSAFEDLYLFAPCCVVGRIIIDISLVC